MKTRTVWACDFGILPGESEDCSARLQAMLDSLEYSEDEAISVQLKRGEYRVYRPVRIRGGEGMAPTVPEIPLLTLELGSAGNTYTDAERLVEPLGDALAWVLWGEP